MEKNKKLIPYGCKTLKLCQKLNSKHIVSITKVVFFDRDKKFATISFGKKIKVWAITSKDGVIPIKTLLGHT